MTITEFASNSIVFVPGPTSIITETNTKEIIITSISTPATNGVLRDSAEHHNEANKKFTSTVHLKETSTQIVTNTQTAVVTTILHCLRRLAEG
jgi:hypothetical protein